MVRCVRVLSSFLVDRVSFYMTNDLIRSKGNVTRTTVHFLNGSVRNFNVMNVTFFLNCRLRIISGNLSARPIRVMRLTAAWCHKRCLIFFYNNRSGSCMKEQFFRHLRRDVRYYHKGRIRLISSRRLMISRLK